jgi:hypothetical protein
VLLRDRACRRPTRAPCYYYDVAASLEIQLSKNAGDFAGCSETFGRHNPVNKDHHTGLVLPTGIASRAPSYSILLLTSWCTIVTTSCYVFYPLSITCRLCRRRSTPLTWTLPTSPPNTYAPA